MKSFMIIAVVFIGLLSTITTLPPQGETVVGLASIMYGGAQICVGVHLKPWILLTTARCVHGKDHNKLMVMLRIKKYGQRIPKPEEVRVTDLKIHPKFDPAKLEYNFAMMTIGASLKMKVEQYLIPKGKFDTDRVINEHIKTKGIGIINLKNRTASPIYDRKVTRNFQTCSELGAAENWYCAEKGIGPAALTASHTATPLFFLRKSSRTKFRSAPRELLGIYSGRNADKEMKGHIFENIYPGVQFIETYINEHPVPN